MARINQGILGGFSGKIANVVGSSWKGIAVMKAMPQSVANPQTASQTAQRARFKNSVAFAQIILADILKPLWDRFAGQQSGFNAFISENITLFDAAMPDPKKEMQISGGQMAKTLIVSCSADTAADEITLGWDDDSGSGDKLSDDDGYAIIVNHTKDTVSYAAATFDRVDVSVIVSTPLIESADELAAYLAFRRKDGTKASKSGKTTHTVA